MAHTYILNIKNKQKQTKNFCVLGYQLMIRKIDKQKENIYPMAGEGKKAWHESPWREILCMRLTKARGRKDRISQSPPPSAALRPPAERLTEVSADRCGCSACITAYQWARHRRPPLKEAPLLGRVLPTT